MFQNTPSEVGGPARPIVHAPSGQQNPPGQTPQQAYDAQNGQRLPQQVQASQATQQRLVSSVNQLRYIKSECLGATNPYLLRDRLVQVIEVLEYILAGGVSDQRSNQVPGNPPQEEHTRAKVQFLGVTHSNDGNTPFATPMAPINNGDVKFTPAPNGGFSVEGGSGQAVQFYDGPAGTPYAGGNNAGQRVEFFDGPGVKAQAPASNQPAGIPSAPMPTLSVEAGGHVPQQGNPLAQSSAFAQAIASMPTAPALPSVAMPIPVLEP